MAMLGAWRPGAVLEYLRHQASPFEIFTLVLFLVLLPLLLLEQFIEKGWSFGGDATATAKAGGLGGQTGDLEPPRGLTMYQLTEAGLMAKGTVQGTEYWKDEELN